MIIHITSTSIPSQIKMGTIKHKLVILITLLLILPLILLLQLQKMPKMGSQYTFKTNLSAIQEEIGIFKNVLADVTKYVNTGPSTPEKLTENLSIPIPGNLRDPFQYTSSIKNKSNSKTVKSQSPSNSQIKTVNEKVKPKPKPKLQITLNGIIFDKENPMAIINRDIYKTSDRIGKYSILSINEKGVQLRSEKENLFLQAPVIE